MTYRARIIALNYSIMLQHGVALVLLGPILPQLMHTFGIAESSAGLLLGLGSVGFMLSPLIAGTLIDRTGVKQALLVGLCGEILFLVLFGFSPSFVWAIIANMLLRFHAAFIETSGNALPAIAFGSSSGSLMNRIHVFFGIGAFTAPIFIGMILEKTGNWRIVFWIAALITLLVTVPTAKMHLPSQPAGRPHGRGAFPWRILRDGPTMLGALTMFAYVGAEVGMSSWIVHYLQKHLEFSVVASTTGLTVLWVGIMVGRYANSILNRYLQSRILVMWAGALGLGAGLGLLSASQPIISYVWLFLVGLCMSGIFPHVMAELNSRDPTRTGAVTGVLTIAAATGAAAIQPVLGIIAESVGLRAAIAVPAILMGAIPLTFGRVRAKTQR